MFFGLLTSCEREVIDLSGFAYRDEVEQKIEELENAHHETEIISKQIQVVYPDIEDEYVCTSYPYEGLSSHLKGGTKNVLLLYLAVAGQGWPQLPIMWMPQQNDTIWMSYGVGNPGDIFVRYGMVNRQKFSASQHDQQFRAIIIPTQEYGMLVSQGVDPALCEEEKACRKLASTNPTVHFNDISTE